jgi:hypothetical protein
LKTGDPKKIQAAEEAYDKAKIQLNTAERVIKIVRDEVDKLTNAVLARMGISRTSQGDPQRIQKSNQGDETTKYLHKNAKEKERQLFAAFDELDKAVQHLNEVKNRAKATNNLDELNNAKDQVRSAAEALVTAANDNLEVWDQAHGAAIPDPRANEAVVVIIKQHGQDALMLKGAALQVSNDALAQLQYGTEYNNHVSIVRVARISRNAKSGIILAYGSAKFYCGWDILLQGNARGSFIVRVCRASVGVGIGAARRLSAPTSLKH